MDACDKRKMAIGYLNDLYSEQYYSVFGNYCYVIDPLICQKINSQYQDDSRLLRLLPLLVQSQVESCDF